MTAYTAALDVVAAARRADDANRRPSLAVRLLLAAVCPRSVVRAAWGRRLVGHRAWATHNIQDASGRPLASHLAPTGADLDDWPGWEHWEPAWPGHDPLRAV